MRRTLKVTALLIAFAFGVSRKVLLGAWFPIDVKSEEANRVAHRSLADRNTKSNSVYHDVLIKIVEASGQAVSGMNYELKAYIGPSKCAKKDVKPEDVHSKCQLNDSDSAEKCTIKAYDQVWTKTFKVNEFSCQPATRQEALQA